MRVPTSTYRLQFSSAFTFADARDVAGYLSTLGAGAVYTSPLFKARTGSHHGYDICDHGALNPELGTDQDWEDWCRTLSDHGLGQVIDVVPNHMGIDPVLNRWWRDVLEQGPWSAYARFFDIDWHPLKQELAGKVLLPLLADQYGVVLEDGGLQLRYESERIVVALNGTHLPLAPASLPLVLERVAGEVTAAGHVADGDVQELLSIRTALANLPTGAAADEERAVDRRRESAYAQDRFARLVAAAPAIAAALERTLRQFNGQPGAPESFDALHDLLDRQWYRLAYWRTAAHEINYRRFFDINDLAGLRMERQEVFDAAHGLVERLIANGQVTGLRVDHPDGLFDPGQYFDRLQRLAARARQSPDDGTAPFFVVIEKILSGAERLPADWRVAGTTGYGFMNEVNGLFVAAERGRELRALYRRLTAVTESFDDIVWACKRLIMKTSLASELNVLAHALNRLSEHDRRRRDFTLNSLRDGLMDFVAGLPIYRTYVTPSGWGAEDQLAVNIAIGRAIRRNPAVERTLFTFIRDVVLPPKTGDSGAAEDEQDPTRFAMRLQQYTGPVQAKGVEDTAFYRYNVLLSLNEVGGDPNRIGVSPAEFHEANRRRREHWPHEMLATATHDHKLGEDVRTRIDAISEVLHEWRRAVALWRRLHARHRSHLESTWAPTGNDEYRFYQALIGIWRSETPRAEMTQDALERLGAYMRKSIREEKLHTSWINPDAAYETAVEEFMIRCLTGPTSDRFFAVFEPLHARLAQIGAANSLSQLVLKMASPGVPDLYQGTELWDYSLVDPDNRRPVDFARRQRLLQELEPLLARPQDHAAGLDGLLASWTDGRVKLFATAACLRARRRQPSLFLDGEYVPIAASVDAGGDVVSFARVLDRQVAIAVAPRLVAGVTSIHRPFPLGADAWRGSRLSIDDLPAGVSLVDVFTGATWRTPEVGWRLELDLGALLARFPVALLVGEAA